MSAISAVVNCSPPEGFPQSSTAHRPNISTDTRQVETTESDRYKEDDLPDGTCVSPKRMAPKPTYKDGDNTAVREAQVSHFLNSSLK